MPEITPDFDLIGGIPPKPRKANPNLWIGQDLIDFLDTVANARNTDRSAVASHIIARAREQWQKAQVEGAYE